MCGRQSYLRCHAGLERLLPPGRAQAPLVAVAQAGEAVLGHGRRQVVADRLGEFEELVGGYDAHHVQAGIIAPVLAAPGAVVAGQRIK